MFAREVKAVVDRSTNAVETELLPQALHQLTHYETVRVLQTMVDRPDRSQFHAVLLVCGSCQTNLAGLQARSIPLVLPRVKDCLSLLCEQGEKHQERAPSHSVRRDDCSLTRNLTDKRALPSDTPPYWVVPVQDPNSEAAQWPCSQPQSWS